MLEDPKFPKSEISSHFYITLNLGNDPIKVYRARDKWLCRIACGYYFILCKYN